VKIRTGRRSEKLETRNSEPETNQLCWFDPGDYRIRKTSLHVGVVAVGVPGKIVFLHAFGELVREPVDGAGNTTGDGFACDRGPQSDFGYCFAVPGGCCAATSNGGGSALLLGLLVGSRLRRRRRSAREQPAESRADTLGTARGRNGEALE